MRKVVVVVILCSILLSSVYAIPKWEKVTRGFSFLEEEKCENISEIVKKPKIDTCSKTTTYLKCRGKNNRSCEEKEKVEVFSCIKGNTVRVESKKVCKDNIKIKHKKILKLEKKGFVCSAKKLKKSVVVICDSLEDGNGDGVCQSGESCTSHIVSKKKITKLYKNSAKKFLREDPSFLRQSPEMEVEK